MKKTLVLSLVSLICGLAFAAGAGSAPTSYLSAFDIQAQDQRGMDINFTLPEFSIKEEFVNGQTFHRIDLPDSGTLMKSGMPELPTLTTTVAIPYQGGVNIEVVHSEHRILTQYNAYPLQQGQELESPKAFVQNSNYYGSGGVYPDAIVEYSDPMIMRDFRVVTIQVNPFSYDATTSELTAYKNIQLRVNFVDESSVNELSTPVQYISPSFDKMYQALIQNYGDYRSAFFANTPPRYLIIHGNTTDTIFQDALEQYVLWKRQKGADVDVASTAYSEAGTSTSSIQTYIRNRYNNPSTRPDYVILIGDTSGSFSIPAFTNNSGGSDYPYTFMNTGDMLGDLFIGRISVENTNQFLILLQKIYLYERDINIATADWLNYMMLAGDTSPSGISTMYINKYIKEMALENNPDYSFTEIYNPDFSSMVSTINGAINQGVGFYSYRGYIDYSPPSESSLFNGFKLLHAVTITCATGNYANGTGETEQFIRYGTTASPKGAVTAIGMSTSSTHTTFNNVLHGGIFHGIFAHGMRTMGEAMLHGKLYMNDIFGVSSPTNVEKFTHWCNLMGDPTMEVYIGIPNTFQLETTDSIPVGLSLLDAAVVDSANIPVEGASVVLSQGFDILSRGYTDAEGNVILVLPEVMTPGEAVLTISNHNFKPLQETINIVDVATLVPAAIVIDDDNIGASDGNNNGVVNAGETVEIYFGLKNSGTETITGITGTMVSDNPWINVTQSEISYPDIIGDATGNNLTPIVIEVNPATPHESMLRLHLLLTDSEGNEYDVSEFITAESAHAVFIGLTVDDEGDGVLDPDETANLTLTLKNEGLYAVQDVYARIYTDNDLISIVNNTSYIGELPINEEVTTSLTESFTVWQRPQTLPGMVMPMSVKLYNAEGFEQIVPFTLTVGEVAENDPLGPDTYGYVIYDWTDTAYDEVAAAAYEWIEIAPQVGGLGTPLPITDVYNSSDEGDQVGAESVATVDLPFLFQFYGRLYDQITVSSNGFITFGVSENGEFRNFRLPGAMGPSPMIAPFWDDLATHSGSGIYYMFDRSNQAFIIEWYNLHNGYNGTSPETFQVILYDQATYNTSLGDGPIKFQYQTFNNVNMQSGNKHGNYCTIGIEDHTGIRGLEYSFNNTYPTAAAPLSDGKALFITNVPIYHEAANLLIADIYLNDANNVVEPGETVDMGIRLENSGNLDADNIIAILSTENEYVTIVQDTTAYYPIGAGASGVNRGPLTFTVSEDCPSGEVVHFSLHIQAGEETFWDRQFSIRVDSSQLQYHSFMISDYDGNYNGIIDQDEEVKLIINLRNGSEVEAREVLATLSTEEPNLTIVNPEISVASIAGNQIMQFVYDLDFSGVSGEGRYLPVNFTANPLTGSPVDVGIYIPYDLPNVEHQFDINDGGFISETGWVWGVPQNVDAYSGDKVWATNLSGEYPANVQYYLNSPKYYLNENSQLNFMHNYNVEQNYDGVNVSISTDGGNNWTVINPIGGYNGSSLAGLGMQDGFTGSSSGWTEASFDLSSYANQEVMFRFRLGSNGSNTASGWYIDDFQLTDVNLKTGHLAGMVYPTSGTDPSLANITSNSRYNTNPKSDGSFRLYLPNGTHSVTASLRGHQNSTLNNVHINIDNPVVTTEFTLINLPAVDSPTFSVNNDTRTVSIMWNDPIDPVFPISAYRVYRKFDSGPYELALETEENNYSEYLELDGHYCYYIVPLYIDVEGTPSSIIDVPFPYVSIEDELSPGLQTNLGNNYPNPFNPTTTISFTLAEAGPASLRIYNSKGQLVRQLANSEFFAGQHSLVWDGRDTAGRPVSSGLYFYRLSTKNYQQTRKMILMK